MGRTSFTEPEMGQEREEVYVEQDGLDDEELLELGDRLKRPKGGTAEKAGVILVSRRGGFFLFFARAEQVLCWCFLGHPQRGHRRSSIHHHLSLIPHLLPARPEPAGRPPARSASRLPKLDSHHPAPETGGSTKTFESAGCRRVHLPARSFSSLSPRSLSKLNWFGWHHRFGGLSAIVAFVFCWRMVMDHRRRGKPI